MPECAGDYLNQEKIPSILEYMENKIQLRDEFGVSFIKKTRGPANKTKAMPVQVKQEEGLYKQMSQKDTYHSHVKFDSEWDLIDPNKKAASLRPVN